MTQYLFSVIDDESTRKRSATEAQPIYEAVDAFNQKLMNDGYWVFAGGLAEPSLATTVDATRGDVVTTDGPFVETKEYVGGFWILEIEGLDAALKLAAEASQACAGKVEVRPIMAEPPEAE